mgnify:CR=1 FL=1
MIRVGLIGAGFVGPAHVEALRRLGYVEVLALAGSNARRAREKADELGIPEACGDYRQLLASPRVTVIHNATPNQLHFAINRDALQAGKHVVSEKPLSLTVEEGRRLVHMARETELVNAIDYNYRGYPLVQQMRAMIGRGDIGRVWAVHGFYMQDWLLYPTDFNWRILPEVGGESRAVADIGSHWCDLAQWVTGQRISRVIGRLGTMLPVRYRPAERVQTFAQAAEGQREEVQVHTEDYASVLFDMDGGAMGSLMLSQVSAGRKNRLWIQVDGSDGAMAWDHDRPEELWIGRRGRPNELVPRDPNLFAPGVGRFSDLPAGHAEGWADALRNLMAEIYDFVRAGKNPVREAPTFPTFYDGLVENRLVDAILESHRRSAWVEVAGVREQAPAPA